MKKKKVIICPKCGFENEKHMVRCASCGEELYRYPVINTPAAKKTSIASLILSFAALATSIVAVCLNQNFYISIPGLFVSMISFVLIARYRKEDGDLTHFAFAASMFLFMLCAIAFIVCLFFFVFRIAFAN